MLLKRSRPQQLSPIVFGSQSKNTYTKAVCLHCCPAATGEASPRPPTTHPPKLIEKTSSEDSVASVAKRLCTRNGVPMPPLAADASGEGVCSIYTSLASLMATHAAVLSGLLKTSRDTLGAAWFVTTTAHERGVKSPQLRGPPWRSSRTHVIIDRHPTFRQPLPLTSLSRIQPLR